MIGLDTGHLVYNYGTKLQAYAMQKLLERNGDHVEIIQWHTKNFGLLNGIAVVLKDISKIKRTFGLKVWLWPKVFARYRALNSFNIKFHIHKYYGSFEYMNNATKAYDKVFCGSDQAWLPGNIKNKWYTLEFCEGPIYKAAYAPSFGIDKIDNNLREDYISFLSRFDAISVREISGQQIVSDLIGKVVPVVLDPTLLLGRADWDELRKESSAKINEPYVFCYLLGHNAQHREAIKKYAEVTGLKIVNIQHFAGYCAADEKFGDYNLYKITPQDFINLISRAAYVCTDSFHCTAFSMQYHKNFSVFHRFKKTDKASTNTRIYSILEQVGLESRIVPDGQEVEVESIDYDAVDNKLAVLRRSSSEYLDNCLGGNRNV